MDVTGNMNPFLFDDSALPPSGEESDIGNPFLNGGGFDLSATSYSGINPFFEQIDETSGAAIDIFGGDPTTYAPEKNPFEIVPDTPNLFDPNNQQVVPDVDFFGSVPTQEDVSIDIFGTPAAQPPKPPPPRPPSPSKMSGGEGANNAGGKPPPPRPPPPSKETKDLLQTVIGAMEATTDTLQYKLNTTVTPCPSPGGGFHSSRSPTPDIQITAPEKDSDAFSTIFGQTIELSDIECDEASTTKPQVSAPSSEPIQTASENTPASSAVDEFDLFGDAPTQNKPKTTQDILSLFNKPTESSKKVDLLSDDLISDNVLSEEQNKTEVSDSSAFDLLSSELEAGTEISSSVNEDISALDPSGTFPELASAEKEEQSEQPTEVIASPEKDSEEKISEPDASEMAASKIEQEQEQVVHLPETVEILEEETKSDLKPLELSDAKFESETKDISSDVQIDENTWTATEISKPESEGFPIETTTSEKAAEDIFGMSRAIPKQIINQEPPSQEAVFEISQPSIPDAFGVVNEPQIPPMDKVFGSKEPEPLSPAPFFSIPENIAPHPTPSSVTSTGFDLFGEAEVVPSSPLAAVTSGAETTGATLFETETPAPNVGMSLFGAGEEASLDIFAESAGNTMINPFAPTPSAPTSVATLASVTEHKASEATDEEFDAFSARFENVSNVADTLEQTFDPFTSANRGEQI